MPKDQPEPRVSFLASFKGDEKWAAIDMSPKEQMRVAKSYAYDMALVDYFLAKIGFRTNTDVILAIAKKVVPADLRIYDAQVGSWHVGARETRLKEGDRIDMRRITKEIDRAKLSQILRGCLKRKGVLIFFDQKIFDRVVIPGQEAEHEALILSDSPLPLDVISGIQPLSETDRNILLGEEIDPDRHFS